MNFKDFMEIKQLISSDKWASFHQYYDSSANQFGKFQRREPYTIIDNEYIKSKFGIWVENKLYSYVLWLENVTRRIGCIRQKRDINRQDWVYKPCEVPCFSASGHGRSLTPPLLPPKPVAYT